MKKPYLFLFTGIVLLAVTGLVYKFYQQQKTREIISTERKETTQATPTPLPATIVIKAEIAAGRDKAGEISLVMFPQKNPSALSAISFKAYLSTDSPDGLAATDAKLAVDNSFESAGWQLIHNQVTTGSGKITVEAAAVLVGKKFVLDKQQTIGTIKIKPVSGSARLSLELDPEATQFLADDAVTALPVIAGD